MTATQQPPFKDRRLVALRRLAWATLVLMLLVTTASAWLRLAQPRPACGDWPVCRIADPPAAAAAPVLLGAPQALAAVRATHRVAASAVLLLVLALTVLTWLRPPRRPAAGRLALALLALALGLAGLGIVTPGSRAAGVLLGNLLGGLLMLALCWRLVVHLQEGPPISPALSRWAMLGACLWVLQTALGALSGSGQSQVAPLAHLLLALPTAACALVLGWSARGQGRPRQGAALLGLAALQFVLGASAGMTAPVPALVLLHNVLAALGLALLLGLAGR